MNQIARCDWLPEPARWSHLACSGPPAVSRKQNFPKRQKPYNKSFIDQVFSVKKAGYWPLSFFFCEFWTSTSSRSINTHKKLELGQYPAILTSHLVNNPYILSFRAKWKLLFTNPTFAHGIIVNNIIHCTNSDFLIG